MDTKFSDKLAEKLTARTVASLPYRGDLYLSEHKQINSISSKVLIGFKPGFNTPTPNDVKAFITHTFDGKLVANLSTARAFQAQAAVTVVASLKVPTRPFKDSANMTSIAATVYMDQDLKETWEVKSNESGKYLSRLVDEDIDSIVSKRRSTMQSQARHTSFASVKAVPANVSVGAIVKVVIGSVLLLAEVKSIEGNKLLVSEAKSGTIYETKPEAVVEVTEMSSKDKNAFMKQVKEFYGQVYSPEYAEEMVKGM